MASPSQIEANQANSKLSTGPRTPEGKAASSRNAQKHGLRGRQAVVHPGEEAEYNKMREGLLAQLHPLGPMEEILFEQIVFSSWNLRRCRLLEAGLLDPESPASADPLLIETNEANLRRLEAYYRRAERSLYKAMNELRALQTERFYRLEEQPAGGDAPSQPAGEPTIHDLSPLISFRSLFKQLTVQKDLMSKASYRELYTEIRRFDESFRKLESAAGGGRPE
jgi:hypothetical protein